MLQHTSCQGTSSPREGRLVTGVRVPRRMIVVGASLAMVLGQALIAGPVAATAPWTPAFTLAPASPLRWINDLSAAGGNVAAAWVSGATTQPSVWVRESVTSGTTWLPPVRLAADASMWAGQISLTSDVASGRHFAVWQELTSNGSAIFMSTKTFGSGSWTAPIQVSDNTGNSSATGPALVVTPAYYFLTYTRSTSSGSVTNRLRIFNRSTGIWAPSISIATLASTTGVVRLAAASNKVAMAWSTPSGAVMLRRGAIGSGSSPVITWTTSNLGSIGPAQNLFLVLSGTRGVVGWSRNGDIFVRRTTNSGVTWSLATRVLDGTPTNHFGVVDAAMSGLDVVFTGVRIAPGSPGYEPGYSFQMISTNAGVTWTNTTANSTPRDGRAVAYVNKPSSGGLKVVGEAWTSDNITGAPIKMMYRRQT